MLNACLYTFGKFLSSVYVLLSMANKAVFDTSTLEHLEDLNVVVPHHVEGEVENRNVDAGIVDGSKKVEVDSTTQCVNTNIEEDIKNAAKDEGGLVVRDVKEYIKKADEERSERGRQTQLQRAHDQLPRSADIKSWQGELSGAKTDCSVLKHGEDTGIVFTEDNVILKQCKKREGVQCISMRGDHEDA